MTEETAAMLRETVFMCPSRCVAAESIVAVRLPPGIHSLMSYLDRWDLPLIWRLETMLPVEINRLKWREPISSSIKLIICWNELTICVSCVLWASVTVTVTDVTERERVGMDGEAVDLLSSFRRAWLQIVNSCGETIDNYTVMRRIKPAPLTSSPPARPVDDPAAMEESNMVT